MKKLKVLFYTELWTNAGIEAVIMRLFRNFDLEKVTVDVMAAQDLTTFYDEEIARLGGKKIITLDTRYKNPAKRMICNYSAFEKVVKENQYDVVHLNMCNAASMAYGYIAKKNGIQVVAYHSHNANLSTSHRFIKTIIHNMCKVLFEKYGDIYFSCSDLATSWMFRKKTIKNNKVVQIPNAIELSKFEFNSVEREEYRKRMNIGNDFLVGHIGRFALAKNHSFLIDIFYEIKKRHENSKLLLVGEGENINEIKDKVRKLGLENSVIFYGVTREIPQMLWAMDAFLLPSLFEGNPVVGIEAQAASLPCYFSDTITKMCQLTEKVTYCSLNDSPEKWAELIVNNYLMKKSRASQYEVLKGKGYDIATVAQNILDIYMNTWNKKK